MLPPKYNHLGRSKKRPKAKTKAILEAEAERDALLKKLNFKGSTAKRPRLRGAVEQQSSFTPRTPDLPPTSDSIG